uniref:HMG box domain-containing protein n=1 Tax=Clytia hemisphaerica TaxID=252671 RepID=A0A7M5XIE3_9CNID
EPSSSKKKKSPSNKKKKKKEKKKKLDNDSQKLIEVKMFEEVEDQSIVKVKKKKVYKKRKGSKVLVRIIKNHCNRGGEIVKTEVVAVDSVPVSDGEKANDSLTLGVGEDSMMVDDDDEIADDEDEDDEEMTLINQGINPKDEEWIPEDEKPSTSSRTKRIKKPPPSKDIPAEKKKTKTSAAMTDKKKTSTKGSSRKGGKNVTIGGKVVGKTTKGMKTTGESKDLTIKKSKKPCPCCTGKLLKISESSNNVVYNTASSEPKNAYNLFCRKYRPIIVQNHPRADFAEISRRLAHIWNKASAEDRAGYFEVFSKMECAFRKKLEYLGRRSPSSWTVQEFEYVKKAISYDLPFQQQTYSETKLQPVDMAAHLQVLGESLNTMGQTLQQQVREIYRSLFNSNFSLTR